MQQMVPGAVGWEHKASAPCFFVSMQYPTEGESLRDCYTHYLFREESDVIGSVDALGSKPNRPKQWMYWQIESSCS